MKKTIAIAISVTCIVAILAFKACKPVPVIESSNFPQDVLNSCGLTQEQFNKWFKEGKVTENGMVLAANSLTFQHNSNCDFYQWSQQMFLWLTSPVSNGVYSSGNTVMESPVFYNVSPPQENGKRILIPHSPGATLRVLSGIRQLGPNLLPIIKSKDGNQFELQDHSNVSAPLSVVNDAGTVQEAASLEIKEGRVVFKDNKGALLKNAKVNTEGLKAPSRILHAMNLNGKKTVFSESGEIVETEEGQALSDAALMAQNGSLVYYITMVNDVYAYYMSGVNNNDTTINAGNFPTTQQDLNSILNYAGKNNWAAPPDPNALAIELKTSWVEAVNLPDSSSYFTIEAIIPQYTKSDSLWVISGERKAKLALVGLHLVGSMNEHPEMVWATFEHMRNTPNSPYTYLDSTNALKTVPQDTGSNWLFSNNAADINNNVQNMQVISSGISTVSGTNGFAPGNTLRTKPFGVANDNTMPNPADASAAASNSELLSINNAVNKMLVGKDIRKNYFLIGATWTNNGTAPNGLSYGNNNTQNGVAIGTSQLANSTMETYFQNGTTYNNYGSCFSCHSNNNSLKPGDLSHVFEAIQPLAPGKK